MLIVDTLKKNGYTVVAEASEGERCIELYRELKPDLVILDMAMGGAVNGVEVLKTLRKETPPAQVIAGGAAGAVSSLECIRNGAADFLLKPYRQDQIVQKVRDLIG